MSIFTADIILYLLLISVFNNPLLNIFSKALGWNFILSEIVIGIILLIILWLIHRYVLRKYVFKNK